MIKEMNFNPNVMTVAEIRKNLGVYYSIPDLYGAQNPEYNPENKLNFLWYTDLNLNFNNRTKTIDFIYNFMKKEYRNHFIRIKEKLNSEYYNLFKDDERKKIMDSIQSAKDFIIKKISNAIDNFIEENIEFEKKMKSNSLINKCFMTNKENKKLKFIFENRNYYKDSFSDYVKFKIEEIAPKEKVEIKVPDFLKNTSKSNDFTFFYFKNDEIKEIKSPTIYSSEIDLIQHSIKITFSLPERDNGILLFPIMYYSLDKKMFLFEDKNLYLSVESIRIEVEKTIEKLKSGLEKITKN